MAEDIYGPKIGLLKGKYTHITQEHVEINIHNVLAEIMERHRDVTLAIDAMFINKIPFIIST